MSNTFKAGDKVVITELMRVDVRNGIKIGDVAKVVYVSDGFDDLGEGDFWCYNPNWSMGNVKLGGNYMRLEQVRKIT